MKTVLSLAVVLAGLVVGAGAQHDPRTIERKLVRVDSRLCMIARWQDDPMSLRYFITSQFDSFANSSPFLQLPYNPYQFGNALDIDDGVSHRQLSPLVLRGLAEIVTEFPQCMRKSVEEW